MSYAPLKEVDNSTVLGRFRESTYEMLFEYSESSDLIVAPLVHGRTKVVYPHKLWVGASGEYRHAFVKSKTAYVIVDENENGFVVEKWNIKQHRKYFAQ